jgi:hypothetical protein
LRLMEADVFKQYCLIFSKVKTQAICFNHRNSEILFNFMWVPMSCDIDHPQASELSIFTHKVKMLWRALFCILQPQNSNWY